MHMNALAAERISALKRKARMEAPKRIIANIRIDALLAALNG